MSPQHTRTIAFILAFGFVFTFVLRPTNACGPFSRYAIFSYTKHPDLPLDRYSRGNIGVIQRSYARSYLYVAYRLMAGGSFDKAEQAALTGLWNERLDFQGGREEADSKPDWIKARAKVPGVGADPKLDVFRAKKKDDYDSFLNCHDDAFKSATKTLEARITKFGVASPEVKEWTLAQEQVFSNCGGGQTIPEPTSSTDPFVKADRAYQIAAAHFYAMDFDDARTHFEKIATDSGSQWHEQGQYLAARSMIRKASLGEESTRQDALTQAEAALKKVLSEKRNDALQKSAQGLLDLVELRLHPETRIRDLAQRLVMKESNGNLKQDLLDYTVLLDKYTGDSDQPLDENLKKAVDATSKDDLTEWLLTFQSETQSSLAHSIELWEKTHSSSWLIACLSKIAANNSKASAVMTEAERVESGSPAFATVQYHLIRLMIEKGDHAGAMKKLDLILQYEATFPPSAVNQFRHQRMTLASDLNDFLKYSLRRPAAFSWDEDGMESPINIKEDDELKLWAGRALLDADSTKVLNEQFPLTLLSEAAASDVLPEHVRRQIALAAWTRAVILGDAEAGKATAKLALVLAPELKSSLNEYLAATTRENRRTAGLYAMLKFPGLKPYVDSSTGRLTPISERDIYRDNWWCDQRPTTTTSEEPAANTEEGDQNSKQSVAAPAPLVLPFLNASQTSAATREYTQLLSIGSAPNYLARETIEWAKRDTSDPRIPEALHMVVLSTRYGCTDKESPKWSKAAFDLLHKRYPKSEWAKKTPYWFKDV